MKTRVWLGGLCLVGAASAFAADGPDGDDAVTGSAAAGDNPYSAHSDQELTNLAADWESLSEEARRALLTEMRGRMETRHDARGEPLVAIRAQRRYGRVVRQPDGSLVRIETTEQIVRYKRLPTPESGADEAFGVGFERRAGERSVAEMPTSAPMTPRAAPPGPPSAPPAPVLSEPAAPVKVEQAAP